MRPSALLALLCLLASPMGLPASAEAWGSSGWESGAGKPLYSKKILQDTGTQGNALEGKGSEGRLHGEGGREEVQRTGRHLQASPNGTGPAFTDSDPILYLYTDLGYPNETCAKDSPKVLKAGDLRHEPELQWVPRRDRYLFPHCSYGRLSNVVSGAPIHTLDTIH